MEMAWETRATLDRVGSGVTSPTRPSGDEMSKPVRGQECPAILDPCRLPLPDDGR